MKKRITIQAFIFALLATAFLFFLHHLPINQLFIDPFSEAIKNHDIMDVAFCKFRDHTDPELFDERIIILNSERTNRAEVAATAAYLLDHGVASLGIDLLFDKGSDPSVDSALIAAVDDPRVVLGYTFEEDYKDGDPSVLGQSSDEQFVSRVNTAGYVNLATNDGFSVRAFEPYHAIEGVEEPSFAVQVAANLDSDIKSVLEERHHEKEWINFKRVQPGVLNMKYPINSDKSVHYAFMSVSQFLKDTSSYQSDFLKDKVVLIGFNGEDDKALSMHDRYFTPLNEAYHGRSLPDMHGVVVHANIISMLLDRDFITEVPEKILYLIAFLIYFFNFFIFKALEKKRLMTIVPLVRVIQALQFVVLFSLCIILITFYNVKFGFIIIITAVILSFELFEFYDHKFESKVYQWLGKEPKPTNHH